MGTKVKINENNTKNLNEKVATPFVRWVGGKRRLVPKLLEFLPKFENQSNSQTLESVKDEGRHMGNSSDKRPNYYESFLGSGSLFFALKSKYGDKFNNYYLSDVNLNLITS